MKTSSLKSLAIMLTLFVFVTGCKKDKEEPSIFIGDFVISNAELTEAITIPIVEVPGNISVPVGTDVTLAIQTALLSAVSCSSADKSYVELREDNSMYLSCEGLNPLSAGTWEEVSATSVKLNMNATAIPPIGFVLLVTDVVKDADGITGIANIPLTKVMIAGIIAPMQLTVSPTAPEIFMVKISIEFIEK